MTPRELFATVRIADRQDARERAADFKLATMAAQGTKDGIEKLLEEIERE